MATQGSENTFEFDCCVRGYHVTEKNWKDVVNGEDLLVCHEENNKYDKHAMAVYRVQGCDDKKINVGHIPIELSSTLRFFVKHGGNISAKVRQKTYRASNLEQGGLEVPITVKCTISGQKKQLMARLKELAKNRWTDPRDASESELYNTRKKVRK